MQPDTGDFCHGPDLLGCVCRDQSLQSGLEYVATWNASQLLTEDIGKSLQATKQKQTATFAKL